MNGLGDRLLRLLRWHYVTVILWILRVLVILVVVLGTLGTLLKGTYSASQWFDLTMYGLTIGGIYALIALGYTMVFGVLRVINFAHGDIMMTGAFAGYFLASAYDRLGFLSSHPVLAMVSIVAVAMAVCTTVALAVERICYRPFRHVATLAPLICGIGASSILQQGVRGMFGSGVSSYPSPKWLDGSWSFLGVSIPVDQVLVISVAVASMVVLHLIVQHTRMGTAMRAVAEDRDAAALMGINTAKIITFTFMLGGGMAGIAGVLYCTVFKQVYFFMGFLPGIKAFAAAVIGGIGNIPAAMVAGILLGIVESVGPPLFLDGIGLPAPYQLRDLIAFTALVMVLIFRPKGIFGERLATKRA